MANVRRAVADDAVAVVDEGTGVNASWRIAAEADVPLGITFQGGIGLVDPKARPNVFRIAPNDHGLAFRLAEYLIPKGEKLALLVDDSGYGQEGKKALEQAFRGQESVVARIDLPASATDVAPQVLRARRAGATGLLVWAQAPAISATITAARSAGWDVPIYTPPRAPTLIRQELSDKPDWVDGLTFASGRMTAEVGTSPFLTFSRSFEAAYGPQEVGVKTSDGKDVIQPPEYAMYSFDFVRVLAAAMESAGAVRGEKVVQALNRVTIAGANGDERGFNLVNHEGVIDDDVYFARFRDMTFAPVEDDPCPPRCRTSSRLGDARRSRAPRRCRRGARSDGRERAAVPSPGAARGRGLAKDPAAGPAAAAADRDAAAAWDRPRARADSGRDRQ